MGYIFNRLKRIVNSYFLSNSGYSAEQLIDESDEELKRIIEELNRDYEQEQKKKSESFQGYSERGGFDNLNLKDKDLQYAFNILGLKPDATNDEIKKVFREKVKQYHPDKFEKADLKTKVENQKKVRELIFAYNLIRERRGF